MGRESYPKKFGRVLVIYHTPKIVPGNCAGFPQIVGPRERKSRVIEAALSWQVLRIPRFRRSF